jgi:osmotically-inducible protein OsmY
VDPHAFKVLAVDQVVYLMGDMLPDQAQYLINIARNTPNVRHVVKLLKYYHLTDQM